MRPANLKENEKETTIKDKRNKTNNFDHEKEKDTVPKPNESQGKPQRREGTSVKVNNQSEDYQKDKKLKGVCSQSKGHNTSVEQFQAIDEEIDHQDIRNPGDDFQIPQLSYESLISISEGNFQTSCVNPSKPGVATSYTTLEDTDLLGISKIMHDTHIQDACSIVKSSNNHQGILPPSYPNPKPPKTGDSFQLPHPSTEELRVHRKGEHSVENPSIEELIPDPRNTSENTRHTIEPLYLPNNNLLHGKLSITFNKPLEQIGKVPCKNIEGREINKRNLLDKTEGSGNVNHAPTVDLPILHVTDNIPPPDVKTGLTNTTNDQPVNKITISVPGSSNPYDSSFGNVDTNDVTNAETIATRATVRRVQTDDITDGERLNDLLELINLNHLSVDETDNVVTLIKNHQRQFHLPRERLSATHILQHRIPTEDDYPINTKQYRFPQIHKTEINRQVQELLEGSIIRPSQSPYNTPIWIVPKKLDSQGNKRWRMVLDFRTLNDKTIGDAYPLPNIVDILDQLGGAKYFSVFDLASGFHQIEMDPRDRHKTAFTTPFGHYEFNRMPFGLKNAPATFQRLMDIVLSGIQGQEAFVYLDDIVVYASSLKEHKRKFEKLMQRLEEANLKLQPDKCQFLRREVCYLGHVISDKGVRPDPKKLEAVHEFPTPKTPKNIKQFLGLAGYYRRFIPEFSRIARPLTQLLKNDTVFYWGPSQQESFESLKDDLCKEPVLQYPDFSKPFILTTDASGYAIGGILSQGIINIDRPIAYASRTLNDNEVKYDTYEKEALAIIYCVKQFRPYLYGNKFTLVTDHKPLMWFKNAQDANMRILRWRLKLAEYDYDVVYKSGKTNVNADALSRNPVDLPAAECMAIQTRSRTKLNPDNPEDAEEIRRLLEYSDSEEEEEDFHEQSNHYSPDLDEDDTCEALLNDEITHQERETEETHTPQPTRTKKPTTTNAGSTDLYDDLSPTNAVHLDPQGTSATSETTIDTSPHTRIQGRNKPTLSENPVKGLKTVITRSQAKRALELAPAEDLARMRTQDSSPDRIPEERDEGRSNADPLPEATVITPVANSENNVNEIINTRDLHFLRKDNLLYFTDIAGNPVDVGAVKLFERQEWPRLSNLSLSIPRLLKRGKRYHIILPISEDQKEGPTMILDNINQAVVRLRREADDLNLISMSIAKSEHILNAPWDAIMIKFQTHFLGSNIKIIVCKGLIKYPPTDIREDILQEMHCTPV